MTNIDDSIIEVICKYPFLTDPIVLFIPKDIPDKDSLKKQNFKFIYPIIDTIRENISELEGDITKLSDEINAYKYSCVFMKEEYQKRIQDFQNIVQIIKDFYDTTESKKYHLLNQYFGINIDLIDSIFKKQNDFIHHFDFEQPLLRKEKIQELENTIIDANQIKIYFQKAIEFLGLEKDWNVKVGDTISIVHTNFRNNGGDIIIPQEKNISVKKLLELIIHEIDAHCVQFSNATGLFSGSIRFQNSESLLEGYALLLEYILAGKYFGENKIHFLLEKKKIHYNYIKKEITLGEIIDTYKGNTFRLFRGFRDIENYTNLKDMVYLQGIFLNLEYIDTYENFEELIQKGCINENYLQKYGTKNKKSKHLDIANTSAIHILNTYFI